MGNKNRKSKKEFKVTNDDHLNPALKKEIQDLRGLIWGNMPEIKNPRFQMANDAEFPRVYIMDTKTSKTTSGISLCHLAGAIQILNELFNEPDQS